MVISMKSPKYVALSLLTLLLFSIANPPTTASAWSITKTKEVRVSEDEGYYVGIVSADEINLLLRNVTSYCVVYLLTHNTHSLKIWLSAYSEVLQAFHQLVPAAGLKIGLDVGFLYMSAEGVAAGAALILAGGPVTTVVGASTLIISILGAVESSKDIYYTSLESMKTLVAALHLMGFIDYVFLETDCKAKACLRDLLLAAETIYQMIAPKAVRHYAIAETQRGFHLYHGLRLNTGNWRRVYQFLLAEKPFLTIDYNHVYWALRRGYVTPPPAKR